MITITKEQSADSDFVVEGVEDGDTVWLSLDKFSIQIMRNDIGISIDVYPKQFEDRDPIASTVAYDDDAESDSEEV
jgi:hypothetical protein